MRVLMIGAHSSIGEGLHGAAGVRGYEVTTVRDVTEAVTAAHAAEFDCALIDVDTCSRQSSAGVMEVRQLSMTSSVVMMTEFPVQRLIDEGVADASIEPLPVLTSVPAILSTNQPALVVASRRAPYLRSRLADEGLRVSVASTLRFAMNLLVDGWCQVVLMDTDIPNLTLPGTVALFHQMDLRHLAILASADTGGLSGISWSMRLEERARLASVLERSADSRLNACGRRQNFGE